MRVQINYSKQSEKFFKKNSHKLNRSKARILIIQSVKKILDIGTTSVDVKALKGNYKGYYRTRYRDIRIIFLMLDRNTLIMVNIEKIDHRGNVYQ